MEETYHNVTYVNITKEHAKHRLLALIKDLIDMGISDFSELSVLTSEEILSDMSINTDIDEYTRTITIKYRT